MDGLKIWWVLAYDQYYPDSALGNVYSTHATQAEAEAAADLLRKATRPVRDFIEVENISYLLGI